ncbi:MULTISPECIES: hypothetical protein [Paraliobacillus]|uniref:hypothetical protein n=1 Tax=Paraliobacillus TaxID=200903 RepID=UPI000DD4450B|nr:MULTISPECIES: hypothetical protein [Paraliobacillus]
MRTAFHKIFWGFLLAVIEIHIYVIDILPEPVGYFLIAGGLIWFKETYKEAKYAHQLAMILVVISIPSVFIQQQPIDQITTFGSIWGAYGLLIQIVNLILVYFVFRLLVAIAIQKSANELARGTTILFKVYMVVMLLAFILPLFSVNSQFIVSIAAYAVLGGLVVEVVFLIWLRKFANLEE